jgi:hypothetical protein
MSKNIHYLYFDGSSYFIGDKSDKTDNDTKVIRQSSDFAKLDKICDELNEKLWN